MSSDKKNKWWWNLILTFFGALILVEYNTNYENYIKHTEYRSYREGKPFEGIVLLLDYFGGSVFVNFFCVVIILFSLWLAYKDYKNRFDD